jgi:phosphoserine phosphatase
MIVAFDVDGTLIGLSDDSPPREDVIQMLKDHKEKGDTVIVWSGGGKDYADMWVRRLGLGWYVNATMAKTSGFPVDITYDDMVVTLGKENICVGDGGMEERW